MKFLRFSIKNSQDFQSYLLPLHHLILSDKVFSLLLLAERPSSLHERCLYTILLAPHYRSYERLDSQFRPHTLSFSKTIQSAPGPMFTRLTASAGCKPKLRFSNIIHTFAYMVFNSEKYVTHMTLIKAQQSIYSFTDRCSVFYPTGLKCLPAIIISII